MGIRTALERQADIVVVAEAADSAEADQLIAHHRPSVAIVDHRLYTDLRLRRMRTVPVANIVVLADELDPDRLLTLLRTGIGGIACGRGPSQDLARAVRCVASGGGFIAPEFAGTVITAVRNGLRRHADRACPDLALLTNRERTVLDLLCQGTTNREIACTLNVSEKTVKFHVSNILAKTEMPTRARLIANVGPGWLAYSGARPRSARPPSSRAK